MMKQLDLQKTAPDRLKNIALSLAPSFLVLFAFFLQLLFHPLVGARPFLLFYPAIILGSLLGRFWPSVAATLIATGCAWYFFIPPFQSYRFDNETDFFSLIFFFTTGLLTSDLGSRSRESERRLDQVFSASPSFMALLSVPGYRYLKVNDQHLSLIGRKDIVGKRMPKVLPELQAQGFVKILDEVVKTGKPYFGTDVPITFSTENASEPKTAYIDFMYQPLRRTNGRIYGIAVLGYDVTERKHLESALQNAIRSRDEFLSIASHELKTPITALKMQVQMIKRRVKPSEGLMPPAEKLAKVLEVQEGQVNRLTELVESLLDVSRIESGKLSFHMEKLDLSELVAEVTDRLADQLNLVGCTPQLETLASIIVHADRYRMEQVVINLLTNAMKYAAGHPVEIRVEKENSLARITVKDRGIGIAKDKQPLIFNRFERAIAHDSISGLGLGLYIAKEIVSAHHGTIEVESEAGMGSQFIVRIPIADPSLDAEALQPEELELEQDRPPGITRQDFPTLQNVGSLDKSKP